MLSPSLMTNSLPAPRRLDYLDAVRAFALLLGIVFHASLSFLPVFVGWAVMDISTSPLVSRFILVSHSFRMALFFLIAGYFGRMAFQRKGGAAFLRGRFLRIVVPFLAGWFLLRPLLISGWIMGGASLRGDVDIAAGLAGGVRSLSSLPDGIFTGTHLWFLYYLAVITGGFLALRAALTARARWRAGLAGGVDVAIGWLARSPLAVFILAIPTALCLWFMRNWGMDTPDQSLVPQLPVLAIYGGGFALGWALQRNAEWLPALTRLSPAGILVGVGSIALAVWLADFQADPGHARFQAAHIGFVAAYGVMMWSLVLLTIGAFRMAIRRSSATVRYLADSSYWLYLLHLPVVVWLQIAFAELPLHWTLKLASISTLTIGCSLLLYDVCVRPTLVGVLLNGRRKPSALWERLRPSKSEPTLASSCRRGWQISR